jgi:Pyridoxamine 5'-phosphate oxidase
MPNPSSRSPNTSLPRLTLALHALLCTQRVAALGTSNPDGTPFVSMVPFAIDASARTLVIHVSSLAPHTRNLQSTPAVSILVMEPEVPGAPVHALPRVTLEGQASVLLVGCCTYCLLGALSRGRAHDPIGRFQFFFHPAFGCPASRGVWCCPVSGCRHPGASARAAFNTHGLDQAGSQRMRCMHRLRDGRCPRQTQPSCVPTAGHHAHVASC